MKNSNKLFTVIGITVALVVALAGTGWFINTTFAQGPWQGGYSGWMHNNQALFDLLKSDASTLLQERQAGKSWIDIATTQGVSEQALNDTLLQPVTQMHARMGENYPQTNTAQMTEWMHTQFSQDLKAAQFGTMTDMHVFGGNMMNGMMNGNGMMGGMMDNWNGNNGFGGTMSGMMNGGMMNGEMMNGMTNGNGMMGRMMDNWNGNDGFGGTMSGMMNGGMMNGGMMTGGMMGDWNNAPNVNATPVPSTQKIDHEIGFTAQNFKFAPKQVQVEKGETVKFTITNQDNFAHNVVSQDGKIAYTLLPANQITSIVWNAPNQAGTYTVICTFHPGMQFQIAVE